MIWKTISLIIGVSSWFPAIAGIYLFNKINRKYKPFIYLLIFYAIVETSGQILIWLKKGEINSILMNIFVLIDYIFIHILLNFWKGKKNKLIDLFIIAILIIIWIIDNLFINKINTTNSTFRIIYSIILVIKIIDVINKQISKLNFQITSDPILIVCLFLLIQFTFKSIYETSFIFSRLVSDRMYLYSFIIHLIIDFSGYAIFTKTILCMNKSIRLTSSY